MVWTTTRTALVHGAALVSLLAMRADAKGMEMRAQKLAARAFRAAVKRVLPSLVTIETHGGVTARPRPRPGSRGPRRRRISPVARPGEGPTTGIIVSSEGHILTSTFNFLHKPPVITVVLHNGSAHVATLLGRDDTRKLCLLKIEGAEGLVVPRLAPAEGLRVGQWAIAVGFGYGGDEPAISAGIISARDRIFRKAVQTDANVSPANYGGPLLDIDGRVIGVCVPLSPRGQGVADGAAWYDSGIGFAVPLDGLGPILEQLKAGEVIQPGKLGIQPAPRPPKGGGVEVRSVQRDSGAEKTGIQEKDIIVALDGQPVHHVGDLRKLLGRRIAGDTVTVKLKRGDETLTLPVVLTSGEEPTEPSEGKTRSSRPDQH
jgi:serine protease Do